MMELPTIADARRNAVDALREQCALDEREAEAQAFWLMAGALDYTAVELRARARQALSQKDSLRFLHCLARRLAGEPLQYILGEQDFMGRAFAVDDRALIPRMDTEVLCERALAVIPKDRAVRVLDIGTGSGALVVTVAAERPEAEVTAVDISEAALALARENARRNLQGKDAVRFVHSDLFSALAGERFDCILSNPPYIPRGELARLADDVRHEPRLALDGGEDGLDFYRRIAREAPEYLTPGGRLLVEVGAGQAGAVAAMFEETIGKPEIFEDLQGIQRVVQTAFERG